jgi:hypothetical protein
MTMSTEELLLSKWRNLNQVNLQEFLVLFLLYPPYSKVENSLRIMGEIVSAHQVLRTAIA